jgi:hypothetical protein
VPREGVCLEAAGADSLVAEGDGQLVGVLQVEVEA